MPFTSHVLSVLAAGSGGSGSSGGGSSALSFLPLLLIVAIGYLLLVRPARNRQRKAMETRSNVQPGAEVTTTAGLLATVVSVEDDTVTLEVAPGVHSRYVKAAIARVNSPFEVPPTGSDPAETTPDPTVADSTTVEADGRDT
ncbi:MAG TPA: preprotein translocase subunit YajC [Mycobacteriales bacterium]|nr:preprotein translocase subunit YajC [Mycobacteriales bacterium]